MPEMMLASKLGDYSGKFSKTNLDQSLRKLEKSMRLKASPTRLNAPPKVTSPRGKKSPR